jgi:4-amino-4-deoxy-L-arabinose transferase-like glycosyltransferase
MTTPSTILAEANAAPRVRHDAPWVAAIALFALFAAALVLAVTRTGPGLSPDSRAYLMSARYMLQGKGISILDGNGDLEPMTHYAPLVSILLAAGGVTGADVTDVARVLNALFFAASVVLAAAVVWRATRSRFAALAAAGLLALSFDLLRTFAMVWSEPPFIFLMLLGILLLGTYIDRRRYAWLIVGAISIGLAFAARYSGAALVASCAVALLMHSGGTWRRRFGDTIVFGLIASLPMALWVARNWLLTRSCTGWCRWNRESGGRWGLLSS